MWKQAQITQTWVQASYFGDTYILLKKIRYRTFGKQGISWVLQCVYHNCTYSGSFQKGISVVDGDIRDSVVGMATLGFWVSVQKIWSGITE